MPNIVSIVRVVQTSDIELNVAQLTHPAFAGKLLYRKLGGRLEVFCQVKLQAAVASGSVLGNIPVSCVPAIGTVHRYTADNDTAPDIRQCKIDAHGVITNTSGLAFSIGHTVVVQLSTNLT